MFVLESKPNTQFSIKPKLQPQFKNIGGFNVIGDEDDDDEPKTQFSSVVVTKKGCNCGH